MSEIALNWMCVVTEGEESKIPPGFLVWDVCRWILMVLTRLWREEEKHGES